jgi:hypothetical protein
MSGAGIIADVPHISEQTGHPTHLTDVAAMHWATPGAGLPGGEYPSKIQFQEDESKPSTPDSYHLGLTNTPEKPQKGRVLTLAPQAANEPPDTYIETKSKNKAEQGPLPPSYPRTRLTPEQARTPLIDVSKRWEGKRVKKRDRRF